MLVPDVLDSTKTLSHAKQRLVRRGLEPEHILVASEQPGFSRASGLSDQARSLEKILISAQVQQPDARLHVVGKGSGGLVVRQFLARQAGLGTEAVTVESAVGLGAPHKGRAWAGWVYRTGVTLPGLGARPRALADLAPNSAFLKQLNQPLLDRQAEAKRVQGVLAGLRQPSLRQDLRNKLASIERQQNDVKESVERALHFPQRAQLSPQDQDRRLEMTRLQARLNRLPAGQAPAHGRRLTAESRQLAAAAEKFTGPPRAWRQEAAQAAQAADHALEQARQTLAKRLSQPPGVDSARRAIPRADVQPEQWQAALQELQQNARARAGQADSRPAGWEQKLAALEPALPGAETRRMVRDLQRAGRKYQAADRLESAWQEARADRAAWLGAVERLTRSSAKQELAEGLAAYAAKSGLAAGLPQTNSRETARFADQAQAAFRAWQESEARLDQAQTLAKEQGLEQVIKPEYWKLRERLAPVAAGVNQAGAKDPGRAWTGLAALSLGPAGKEQELFAKVTQHRLDRELAAWKRELIKAGEEAGVQRVPELAETLKAARAGIAEREQQKAWLRLAQDCGQAAELLKQQAGDREFVTRAFSAGTLLDRGRSQEQEQTQDWVKQGGAGGTKRALALDQLGQERRRLEKRLLDLPRLDAGPAPQLLERIAGQAARLGTQGAAAPADLRKLARSQDARWQALDQLTAEWKQQVARAQGADRDLSLQVQGWSACQDAVAASRGLALLDECGAALARLKTWKNLADKAGGQQRHCQDISRQFTALLGPNQSLPAKPALEPLSPQAWQPILHACGQRQEQASQTLQRLSRELAKQPEWILPGAAGLAERLSRAVQDPGKTAGSPRAGSGRFSDEGIQGLLDEISGLKIQTQKTLSNAQELALEAVLPGQARKDRAAPGQDLNQALSHLRTSRWFSQLDSRANVLQDVLAAKALLWQEQDLLAQSLDAVQSQPGAANLAAVLSLMNKLTANRLKSLAPRPGALGVEAGVPAQLHTAQKQWQNWQAELFSRQQGLEWASGKLELGSLLSAKETGWKQQAQNLAGSMLQQLVEQAARQQVAVGLEEARRLSAEARDLLSAPGRQLRSELRRLDLLEQGPDPGVGLSLVTWAQDLVRQGVTQGLGQELASLERMQDRFVSRLDRGVLELSRAQGLMAINGLSRQFADLGAEVKRLWENVGPEAGAALDLQGLLDFSLDQETLQAWQQEVFGRLLAENPLQQDLSSLGQAVASLQTLIQQPGSELGDWLVRSGVSLGVERLQNLQAEAQELLRQALTAGAVGDLRARLNTLLLQLDQEAGRLSRYLDQTLAKLPAGLVPAGLRQTLQELRDLPGTLAGGVESLLQDLEGFVSNQVLQAGMDRLNSLLGQEAGQATLWNLGVKLQLSLTEVSGLGQTAVAQMENALSSLGTGNLTGLWESAAAALSDVGGNLLGLIQDLVASASPVDLGGLINITNLADSIWTGAGDLLGQFTGLFELQVNLDGGWWQDDSLWQQLTGIFNAENWKFDFYQTADGFLKNIQANIEDLVNSGLAWVEDRWNEYTGQAQEYWDILAGGPERWWQELSSGKWDESIGNLLTQYLPPEYQPAVSALQNVRLVFNADFELSADWVTNILDNLSAYLSEDLRAVYQQLRDYYDLAEEYVDAGTDIYNAIASSDVTGVLTNLSRLANFHFSIGGQIYEWGRGHASKKGSYSGQPEAPSEEDLWEAYLNTLPPGMREQTLRALENGALGGNGGEREIDVADYDPAVDGQPAGPSAYAAAQEADAVTAPPTSDHDISDRHPGESRGPGKDNQQTSLDTGLRRYDEQKQSVGESGPFPDKAVGASSGVSQGGEGEGADLSPGDLGPPRMSGVPTPPAKQSLWDKMKNVYQNMNPAGLSKNAALAAAPDGAKKASDKIKENASQGVDNVGDTIKAIKDADKLSTKAKIATGLAVSVYSHDIYDGKPEYNNNENRDPETGFDSRPEVPAVLFLNGMNTPNKEAKKDLEAIEQRCGYSVARISNNTHGLDKDFGAQGIGQETGAIDITPLRAAELMKKGIAQKGEVYVIAHSQGSAIFERALELLTPEERAKVHYQGFGPQKYIDSKEEGLAEARNVRHRSDPIPHVANTIRRPLPGVGVKDDNWVEFGEEGVDLKKHKFRDVYVDKIIVPPKKE